MAALLVLVLVLVLLAGAPSLAEVSFGRWLAPHRAAPPRVPVREVISGRVKLTVLCPDEFAHLRKLLGISESVFVDCMDVSNLKAFASDSKSGQQFWYSLDNSLFVKTISGDDWNELIAILPSYLHHVCGGESLIGNILAAFRVKRGREVQYFMVCSNVYSSCGADAARFDLKGSLVGRKKTPYSTVFKDLDFLELNESISIGAKAKTELMAIVRRDVAFLRAHQIMDYSLLLGVGHTAPSTRMAPGLLIRGPNGRAYSFGIVDFLQRFTSRKQLEHAAKKRIWDGDQVSCVPPDKYAERFAAFLDRITQ